MNSVERPYIILVEHSPAAAYIFEDIRAMGFRVFYLGKDKSLQEKSDLFRDLNVLADTDLGLAKWGEDLKSLAVTGVYSLLEHAKFAEQKIASFLGKPAIPYQTLLKGRDKVLMRQCIRDSGLPAPEFYFIPDSAPTGRPPLSFPFIIKPNLGYASGGVQLVKKTEEFEPALRTIRRLNRFVLKQGFEGESGAICEQFIQGPEFSIDSITAQGITRSFCVCGRGFPGKDNFQDYVYFSPPESLDQILQPLESNISTLLKAMGYTDGPSHTEARYHAQTDTWVILETALRVGFAGNMGRLYQELSGIPYNQLALKASLRQLNPLDLAAFAPKTSSYGVLFTPDTGEGGVISSFDGMDLLNHDSRIKHYYLQKKAGEKVIGYPKGLEYLGVALGVTDTRENLKSLIEELCSKAIYKYE